MLNKTLKVEQVLALSLAASSFLWAGTSVRAQSAPAQDNRQDNKIVQENDSSRREELAQFDQFLDKHPEIAEQLRKDPSLADNQKFLQTHPALQTFLQDQPDIRAQLRQHPEAFIRQEDAFDRRDDGFGRGPTTGRGLPEFHQFLDSHREIADQLRRDPSQANNDEFQKAHPEFQAFLREQPGVRDELRGNPNEYMRQEDAFGRDNDRSNGFNGDDTNRRQQVAEFDRFLDSHQEIAEQLRKDPSLADNRQFLQTHPALQTYLQQQPGIRDQLRDNPNAFMRQEDAFDRDTRHDQDQRVASFKGFLDGHSDISKELSKDPTRVKDHDYVQKRPELEAYLNTHADVREQLMNNPEDFVHAGLHYNTNTKDNGQSYGTWSGKTPTTTTTPGKTPTTTDPTPAPTPAPTHDPSSKQ